MHRKFMPASQKKMGGEREEGFTTATQILDESHGFQRLLGAIIPPTR